ncbi:aromatic acid exporter family protein [Blastococcus sp. Marseille-P5729]|uniref:FUSC family protein n=1 Tax=Blastococcus sp. Marseille-P5729 TaxID=2086582 RepID=UPI0018FEF596|nr:FUSC family protein [Blastococcus sp. Marseille-P5729]
MESHRLAARYIRDLTHELSTDLAPRAAEASRRSAKERVRRLRTRSYFILQCSTAAGVSWWLAQHLLGHTMPFLAPVAAIICLGLSFGQRWRRVVEVTVGVATGVLVGSAFAHFFGSGAWQIIVVAAGGMVLASLLGGGALISTQAAVQGTIVVALIGHPEGGFDRWLDALIGAMVALVAATITPASPIDRPRDIAARIGTSMAEVLRESVRAYQEADPQRAARALQAARESELDLDAFSNATKEGLAVVRHSPLRRRRRRSVQEIAEIAAPLDRAVRNLRVLVRRIGAAIWREETISEDIIDSVRSLADIIDGMSGSGTGRRLSSWRSEITELGNRTSTMRIETLSAAVLIAQMRSIVVDLLEMTGLSYEQARETLSPYADR